ncbi:site-2 protease family protein [Candidatus Dependentiae bacterium]|nr:site-2 protease family protein [Candidatus Dependentiae bacterium]
MNNLKSFLLLLLAIGIVIFVHEFGHFTAANFFNVRTPTFSVGFGPKIFSIKTEKTEYKISAIPLGGYTTINQDDLAKATFFQKFIILIAGVIFNLIFAFIIFYIFFLFANHFHIFAAINLSIRLLIDLFLDSGLYIFNALQNRSYFHQHNLQINTQTQLFFLAIGTICIEVAFFNILPIPFLDGGQITKLILQKIFGGLLDPFIDLILLILVIITIVLIKRSKK